MTPDGVMNSHGRPVMAVDEFHECQWGAIIANQLIDCKQRRHDAVTTLVYVEGTTPAAGGGGTSTK